MGSHRLYDTERIDKELAKLRGKTVARPKGELEGHAGGGPIEEFVFHQFVSALPGRAMRQHEAVNRVLLAHPDVKRSQRYALLGSAPVRSLLATESRIRSWTPAKPLTKKQQDTADIILFKDPDSSFNSFAFTALDVKSNNLDKKSRPPNIISSDKLHTMASLALDLGLLDCDIHYAGVHYRPVGSRLVIEDTRVIELFKTDPALYINHKANQIQFDPFEVTQEFSGTRLEWCDAFEAHFLAEQEKHISALIAEFVCSTDHRAARTSN